MENDYIIHCRVWDFVGYRASADDELLSTLDSASAPSTDHATCKHLPPPCSQPGSRRMETSMLEWLVSVIACQQGSFSLVASKTYSVWTNLSSRRLLLALMLEDVAILGRLPASMIGYLKRIEALSCSIQVSRDGSATHDA